MNEVPAIDIAPFLSGAAAGRAQVARALGAAPVLSGEFRDCKYNVTREGGVG